MHLARCLTQSHSQPQADYRRRCIRLRQGAVRLRGPCMAVRETSVPFRAGFLSRVNSCSQIRRVVPRPPSGRQCTVAGGTSAGQPNLCRKPVRTLRCGSYGRASLSPLPNLTPLGAPTRHLPFVSIRWQDPVFAAHHGTMVLRPRFAQECFRQCLGLGPRVSRLCAWRCRSSRPNGWPCAYRPRKRS